VRAYFILAPTLGVLATVGMTFGAAQAASITILEDPIRVTQDGAELRFDLLPGATEAIRFTFTSTVNVGATGQFSRDLTEPLVRPGDPEQETGDVSDRLRLDTTAGSNIITVQFASDPDVDRVPKGSTFFSPLEEDGTIQSILFLTQPTASSNSVVLDSVPANFITVDTFKVQSDIRVPQPSALALLFIGFLSLIVGTCRRSRGKPAVKC
jgi:hypothetical protein